MVHLPVTRKVPPTPIKLDQIIDYSSGAACTLRFETCRLSHMCVITCHFRPTPLRLRNHCLLKREAASPIGLPYFSRGRAGSGILMLDTSRFTPVGVADLGAPAGVLYGQDDSTTGGEYFCICLASIASLVHLPARIFTGVAAPAISDEGTAAQAQNQHLENPPRSVSQFCSSLHAPL